jgi:hypothetical protein
MPRRDFFLRYAETSSAGPLWGDGQRNGQQLLCIAQQA